MGELLELIRSVFYGIVGGTVGFSLAIIFLLCLAVCIRFIINFIKWLGDKFYGGNDRG